MSFNKESLVEQIVESRLITDRLKNNNSKLLEEIEILKKANKLVKINNTDEDIVKKVLELRARNLSPIAIEDKLRLANISMSLKAIEDVIGSDLSIEMELYFSQCKANFIENIRINTSYYQQSSIDEYQRLIDSAYKDLMLVETDDLKQRDALRTSISNLIAKRDNLAKNIDESNNMTIEDDVLNETTENFKESTKTMLKLYKSDIKIIGDEEHG